MTANMRILPVMTPNMRNLPVMTSNMRNSLVIKDNRYMSHIGHRKNVIKKLNIKHKKCQKKKKSCENVEDFLQQDFLLIFAQFAIKACINTVPDFLNMKNNKLSPQSCMIQ